MSNIMTPEFRGSFVNLFEPRGMPGVDDSKKKYQITMVLPKTDPFWAKLDAAIKEIAIAKWGKVPPKFRSPIKDGDEMDRVEFADCKTLQATSLQQPGVVDEKVRPIIDAEAAYSGAYYRMTIVLYAWEHAVGGKGVSASVQNVMKTRDGEAFSGRRDPTDDFSEFASADAALLE
jgi:hypothetical protein